MSYEIVKGLKLKKDVKEVWVKSSSNNVSPKYYDWAELKGLSYMYKTLGEEEVIKKILRSYWEESLQPGTKNNFWRAATLYHIQNPKISYSSIGPVKDEVLFFGPLEDLPKYLNHDDSRVQRIVKHRLNGATYDRANDTPIVTMTPEELEEGLFKVYSDLAKRDAGKFIINRNGTYVAKACGKHRYYITCYREHAKVFKSREDAICWASRYNLAPEFVEEL